MRQVAIALGLALISVHCRGGESPALEHEGQKLGYSIGYQVGSDFRRQRIELRAERVVAGAIDALEDEEPDLTPTEMRQALAELQQQATERTRSPSSTD